MPIEHEAKVLNIEPDATERLILDKGGQKLGEWFMRRYGYDITLGDQSKWIRLRDTGDEITLTVKQITSDTIDGTHEIEVGVDDFAATNALLGVMGFGGGPATEPERTISRFGEVRVGARRRVAGVVSVRSGSIPARS